LADQNAAGFHRFLVAFFPMRDFLLLAKNLFIAATERGFRKHFAHFQANGDRHCVRQLADAIGWTSAGAPFGLIRPGPYWHPRRTIDDTPEVPDIAPPAAWDSEVGGRTEVGFGHASRF
jgi:hypothetical protein